MAEKQSYKSACFWRELQQARLNMLGLLKHRGMAQFRKLRRNFFENGKVSYSQSGEDLIIDYLLQVLGIQQVNYLDVGAHHPTYLSNTYLFYVKGGRGICVEPDPALYAEFPRRRPEDKHLNCGVAPQSGEADFFVMSTSTLNTFSRAEAKRYESYGNQRIIKTLRMSLKTINEIIEQNFTKCPNLISLDVEGLDFAILQSLDFTKYRPAVFCLETLSYTEDNTERKLTEIVELMHDNGYLTYADTYINTIFVESSAWAKRK